MPLSSQHREALTALLVALEVADEQLATPRGMNFSDGPVRREAEDLVRQVRLDCLITAMTIEELFTLAGEDQLPPDDGRVRRYVLRRDVVRRDVGKGRFVPIGVT